MKTIILKKQRSHIRNQRSVLIFFALCGFALSPLAQATPQVVPPPDGCYPGFTTAEGCRALQFLGAGAGNTGVGWYSLFFAGDSNFNTGVGAGTLVLNTGDSNTAVGAAALLLNTTGTDNVAVGTDALVNNDTGFFNEAMGSFALSSNVSGIANVAIGDAALNNADSNFNTAVGFAAGQATIAGFDNIYLGDTAGTLDLTGAAVPAGENSTIRIGSLFTNSQCFIGGIATHPQVWNGVTVCQVTVNGFGQLGVDCVNPNNPGATPASPGAPVPHSAPQTRSAPPLVPNRPQRQAMLNDKVEKLQATVAQQQKQIETLTAQLKEQAAQFTAQLKEQAAQIQKVSAQLEMGKPATKVVVNKP